MYRRLAAALVVTVAAQPPVALHVPAAAVERTTELAVYRGARIDSLGPRIATWRTRTSRVPGEPGRVAYVSEFLGPTGAASVTDSVETSVDGLVPVSERSHQPTKTLALAFDADSVVAVTVTPDGQSTRSVARHARPFYNSTDTPLAVVSLPARVGATVVLPEYSVEQGFVGDTLRVLALDASAHLMHVRSATPGNTWTWCVATDLALVVRAVRAPRTGPGVIVFANESPEAAARQSGCAS